MIREASEADIPALVRMGEAFNKASGTPAKFNRDDAASAARNLIASPSGVVLVSEAGMIGGMMAPAYFNSDWVMAVELFWWAEDRRGLRLLGAFEKWAIESGANEVRMTTLGAIKGPERIPERRGYAPCEISYQKVL